MATSGPRERGGESSPEDDPHAAGDGERVVVLPEALPEQLERGARADADVQHLIGPQEERSTHPLGGSSTLKREGLQTPDVKEEQKEFWLTLEGEHLLRPEEADLTELPLTGVSAKTEDHEEKTPESLRLLGLSVVQQQIGHQEERPSQPQGGSSTLKEEDPQPPHINKEEEFWVTQGRQRLLGSEEADLTRLAPTGVSVKTEDKPPESSELYQTPSEENRGAEPPSSSSPQHSTTEADGDPCEGSQADNLLAPLSGSEDEDGDDTQERLSSNANCQGGLRTDKHSECSKKETGRRHATCSVCAKSFYSKWHLSRHMRTHTGENPYNCLVCVKSFSVKAELTRHMRSHTGEKPFRCSTCAKGFSWKSHLTQHMMIHTGEKPFACSVCAKTHSSKWHLSQHMQTHTGEKPFSCSMCEKRFSYNGELTRHMLMHTGENPFSCSECAKSFSYKWHLSRHMLTHTGEKPFRCSMCGKSFAFKSSLTKHMLIHTGEKPIRCSVCGKKFSCQQSLTHHMLMHTGVKPFGCSVCGQRFFQKSSLVSHIKTHSEETPIGCSVCAKTFSSKWNLTRHMLAHTGEKPFSCSVCLKSFSYKSPLTRHMVTCRTQE